MKLRKLFAVLLAVMLTVCSCAMAETVSVSTNPLDMEVMIGNKVYTFACTLEELEAQGITITADGLNANYWHDANNGRAGFDVLLQGTKGDDANLSVCGVKVTPNSGQPITMPGGIVIGESTRDDCLAAYGTPYVDNDTSIWYNMARNKVQYRIYFDDNMVIKDFQMISYGPYSWGFEFDGQAGVEQSDLPDPTSMNFDQYIIDGKLYSGQITLADLTANGWVLDHSTDLSVEVDPQGKAIMISNPLLVLGNGESTLQVFPINRSEAACALSECGVLYVGANLGDNVSIVLADGLTLGDSYDAFVATFGEAGSTEDHSDDGYIYYEHTVMGGVTYGFRVTDGIVSYIRIRP